jgi:hypothetical protein
MKSKKRRERRISGRQEGRSKKRRKEGPPRGLRICVDIHLNGIRSIDYLNIHPVFNVFRYLSYLPTMMIIDYFLF